MIRQTCPNCGVTHDVGVYVTGQRVLCRCGIHFEVRRTDVSSVGSRISPAMTARGRPVRTPGSMVAAAAPEPEPDAPGALAEPLPSPVESAPSEPLGAPPELATDKTFIARSGKIHIPGYELQQILGRGGMGEVWRAEQKSLGRVVAVKLLPPKLASDPEFVTRFDKESTALAALSHPNIIQIIDRGVSGEHYFFVMEFVAGQSLRDVMNGGQLRSNEALSLVAQIGRAIDYAHDKHIIHRDLKPENILIDERGHVKVADFGLAGIGAGAGSAPRLQLTATSVAMGTVNYMAPEQRRDAKHVDGRADLYSLGVILFEMLTGELPIGRFKMPSERIAGLDPRVDQILSKLLETEPADRYQKARDSLVDIEAVLGSSAPGVLVTPPGVDTSPMRGQKNPTSLGSWLGSSWKGLRVALMVIGAASILAYVGTTLRRRQVDRAKVNPNHLLHGHSAAGELPPNTYGELFVGSVAEDEKGRLELKVGFDAGEEEMNAHAGNWRIEQGKLRVTQAGSDTGGQKLVPRAYVAHRYYSADDFAAEVEMTMRDLESDFPGEPDAQHFAELSFRIKDLQVSVFAIPGDSMRLGWRYYTPDGVEQVGNSARDLENMVEDEMPVPPNGTPFKVRLTLKRRKNGVEVEAFLNRNRFARKFLMGLEGRTAKVALGCRNLHCEFDNLSASGKKESRPLAARVERPE